MMAQANQQDPSGMTDDDSQDDPTLDTGQRACSPMEEHLLKKTMTAVMAMLNQPKMLQNIEHWIITAKNVGTAIGNAAFMILFNIYQGAAKGGTQLPLTVFFAEGGAVYQTIDDLINTAKHMNLPGLDEQDIRQEAYGVVCDSVKQHFPDSMEGQDNQQSDQNVPDSQQMMAANPLSHAVGQGLMQQGMGNGQ